MTIHTTYLDRTIEQLERVRDDQDRALEDAARACAASIDDDGLVFTFGTGHGSFAALETFPRTGTIAGFRPIVETPIAMFHHVLGDQGASQYRFLHTREGYGHAILRSHRLLPKDTMILFSHSGINAVVLDIATECKQRGLTVIGVTSIPHSSQVQSRHSSGQRLYEVADIVIDTGVPLADAGLYVDGLEHPLGPTSTVVASAIAHALVARTVELVVEAGNEPFVMVNPNTAGAERAHEQNDRNYEELWRRLSAR